MHMTFQPPPWQPLYSVDRSNVTELCVTGIVVAVGKDAAQSKTADEAAEKNILLKQGDVDYTLWTRSLLKPFQLAAHFQILREHYPQLRPEHYALMSSSHNSEMLHLELLEEIMQIGRVTSASLKCPAAFPLDVHTKERLIAEGKKANPLYHQCSGNHLSYILSLQAQGLPIETYTDFDSPEHSLVEAYLNKLLERDQEDSTFQKTTDGCQLPNQALKFKEIATLYQKLSCAAGGVSGIATEDILENTDGNEVGVIGAIMERFPLVIGGTNRLDTRITQGALTAGDTTHLIAKDGAQGLLAIGVSPTERYPEGVGIVIKLASGYDILHMETIAAEILRKLDLGKNSQSNANTQLRSEHLRTKFSF